MTLKQIGSFADFPAGSATQIWVDEKPIAIFRLDDGRCYATSDRCTHGNGSLSEGLLDNNQIECPLHRGKFDVMTGRAVALPCTRDLRTFPLTIENGTIWLELDK